MFLFELALALGEWDVDGLAEAMPLPILWDWYAFWRMRPFGPRQQDRRAAMVASTIANTMISMWAKHPRSHVIRMEDLMPSGDLGLDRPKKTAKTMFEEIKAALTLSGALR